MKRLLATLAFLFAWPGFGTTQDQTLLVAVPEERLILVARGDQRTIEACDDRFGMKVWTVEGVAAPRLHAVSEETRQVAIADPIANEVVIVSLKDRRSDAYPVAETPVAMDFIGERLFVLSRDGDSLSRIGGGRIDSVPARRDSVFLAEAAGRLLVYSRLEGAIDEFDATRLVRTRTLQVPPFASDFEADGRRGYLVYPRSGKMVTVLLAQMRVEEEFAVGAVPVDIALEGDPNLVSAGIVSVADPSSKRIWRVERSQSSAEAFGRGFLRGLLGLGLYTPRSTEFPTGVDRIWSAAGKRFAYDSSSRTLYQIVRRKSRMVVRVASPQALAVVAERIALWNGERQALEFRTLGN